MHIVRVEHPVESFEAWKQAFDADPIGRRQSGVRRYRIMRGAEDRSYLMIDLEFDDRDAAESFLASLRDLWGRTDVMRDPQARIAELVEAADL